MEFQPQGRLYPDIAKPLYSQLHDALVSRIESGELKPGDHLPGERKLSELYDISRVTVRKCLNLMVQEGYLVRSHGRDTTVATPRINHHFGRFVGSIEEFLNLQAFQIDIEIIRKGYENGDSLVTKQLAIPDSPSVPVYCFVRKVIVEGQPLAINTAYVPQEVGQIVDTFDLATAKVFVQLQNKGYSLGYVEQEITAELCTETDARQLNYEAGQPVMVIVRTSFLENGTPVRYERTVYRGDLYQYSFRLQSKS